MDADRPVARNMGYESSFNQLDDIPRQAVFNDMGSHRPYNRSSGSPGLYYALYKLIEVFSAPVRDPVLSRPCHILNGYKIPSFLYRIGFYIGKIKPVANNIIVFHVYCLLFK